MILYNQRLSIYQRWLKEKFQQIESLYYDEIDELTQYISDLDLPGVPKDKNGSLLEDFTLQEYSFVKDWEDGMISSRRAYEIMSKITDLRQAAQAKITKRLSHYMHNYDVLREYIKPTISELNGECVKQMMEYLEMLRRVFKKMAEIDDNQIQVTWVQQFFKKDKPDELIYQEMSLNQSIHHISAFIHKTSGQRFFLKDQIVVFDEEIGFDDRAIHWLFAPRQYIELIRVLFNVKEKLGDEEIEFLKNIIKEVE